MSKNVALTFDEEVLQIQRERHERRALIKAYPPISVVISTARPLDLESILKQLEVQTLETFQLVLGIHGFNISLAHQKLIKKLQKRSIDVIVENFDKSLTLGQVLTALSKASYGKFVTKMDDDDVYGPEHLRDLADVAITMKADVVGKAMNYVYLEDIDLTVRRVHKSGIASVNQWSDWVCGGTIMVKRDSASAVGWFGEGKSAVDTYILGGIQRNGGKIWRMFGTGYIYRRSIAPQTYMTNSSKYLRYCNEQRVGVWSHSEFGVQK
jgi:hypothetical protein